MGLIEKLREARIRAGLRQSDVEAKTGINAKTISNWENGVSKPDVDSIALLCKLYKIDPNELFEWPTDEYQAPEEVWTVAEEIELENYKTFLRSKREK